MEEELRQLNSALLFLEGLMQIGEGMAALEEGGMEDDVRKDEKECSRRQMS